MENKRLIDGFNFVEELNNGIENMTMPCKTMNEVMIELAEKWDDLKDTEKNAIACKIAGVREINLFKEMISFIKKSVEAGLIEFIDETNSYKFDSQKTMQDFAKELGLPVEYVRKMVEEIASFFEMCAWTDCPLSDEEEANEYKKLTESRKSHRKSELNELVLDLSLGIKSGSKDKLKDLLKGVTYIKCVKVRGMICDTANNMHFVLNTLEDMGVIVGDINIEVEM